MSPTDAFPTFGFVVIPQFFDAVALADEIDQVMQQAFASDRVPQHSGIHFQYVPMMTAETPVSLSLLDRAGALAETLLGRPVLPTRAKGTRYFGNTPWHRDSESLLTSIGFLAYCESLKRNTKSYFESIHPAAWDGGYDVDRYPSYGPDWRNSGRSSVAQLERLGVYDLAARQEAFTRSRKPST